MTIPNQALTDALLVEINARPGVTLAELRQLFPREKYFRLYDMTRKLRDAKRIVALREGKLRRTLYLYPPTSVCLAAAEAENADVDLLLRSALTSEWQSCEGLMTAVPVRLRPCKDNYARVCRRALRDLPVEERSAGRGGRLEFRAIVSRLEL